MAGILDSSRFIYFLSQELNMPTKNIKSLVSETSKLEDISERYLEEIDKIH